MVEEVIPTELKNMEEAFKNREYRLVEKIAHKLKGGVVYVGATRIKYACQYFERYLKTGNEDLFEALYYQVIKIIEETINFVMQWLKKNSEAK